MINISEPNSHYCPPALQFGKLNIDSEIYSAVAY